MSHYDDVRDRIHRGMVPLPILYRKDLSVDHAGLERYVAWHLDNGTQNLCLTFTYSQLDFVTPEEIVEITHTVAGVVGDKAVFISCTGGGPLVTVTDTVRQIEKAGAHATFVHLPEYCLQNPAGSGELYVRYIRDVSKETDLPLLATALPIGYIGGNPPMLTAERLGELCEDEQFIGIKDDIYILNHRMELTRQFSGRMGIIGGGIFRHYIFFHHYPNQGEFHGITNPKRGARCFELMDENNYLEVLKLIDEDELVRTTPSDLHWMARNQVVFYGMGFAETYLMRSPIESATEAQAEAVIDDMRKMPTLYERVER